MMMDSNYFISASSESILNGTRFAMNLSRFLILAGTAFGAGFFSPPASSAEKVTLAPHTFSLPEGYTLKAVAATPLVERPIHMCFDDEGALYVTDSSGNTDKAPVQLKDPKHRILRLVDRDGDGVFDDSTVFAEKVPFPEGILVYKGDVYVAAPPHIWKFTDKDGDHVADERVSWFNGGTVDGCGNDLHGPYLGPDGYFYWTKGGFQEQSLRLGNGQRHMGRAAHIFRAKPDGSEMEVVITGGMNNPVGLAFSESGERFLSGTFFDLSKPGRRDGILHAVYGGMYGRQNDRVLAQHPHTGDLLPILAQMGPAAPSGILMPRNNALGVKGDLLCADFNLRRISRHQLTPSGSSYTVETDSFLESDQTDFHPTDVIEDADGSLLVADTGSWYHMCCPTSKSSKPEIFGAIYRIQKAAPTVSEDPRGLKLNWKKPAARYLSDKRPVVVSRAIDALAKEENIDALRSAKAQVPAVWSLHRISGTAARKAVRERILNGSSNVRVAAIHSAGLWRDSDAVSPLIETLEADDAQLRRLAAMALGKIGDKTAVKALAEAGSKDLDPFLKHAITYALFEMGDHGNVPEDHPLGKQLRLMEKLALSDPAPHSRPEIQLAEPIEVAPEQQALQKARMKELSKYLSKGDPKRGKELFNNPAKSMCILCHQKGELGAHFGPDLTKIGAIRTKGDLLEAIVYPSASIARYYEIVTVRMKDAETSGLLLEDGVDQLILATAPGAGIPIPLEEITEAKYSNLSLMPQVFDGLLKPEEIADLIAYLSTAK
jgi:putative membrane-bound dehydrogenase-like protein